MPTLRRDMIFIALILACWHLQWIHCVIASNSSGNGLDPFATYQFTKESCANNVFPNQITTTTDSEFPSFIRRTTAITIICSRGLGVQSSPLIVNSSTSLSKNSSLMLSTSSNNQGFLRRLQKDKKGVSLELWIKPLGNLTTEADALMQLYPIFVIGSGQLVTPNALDETLCDSQYLDLHLGQRNNILELTYRNSDTTFLPCQRYPLVDFPLIQDRITHVVITLSEKGQQVFINGQGSAILHDPFRNTFPNWSEQYNMHFFSHLLLQQGPSAKNLVWKGQLFQFAMYSGVLTEQQVKHQMAAGLPRSPPFAISYSVAVRESAQGIPVANNSSWQESPEQQQNLVAGHVGTVTLRFSSVNLEVDDLLRSYNIQNNVQALVPLYHFYITRLPARGQLYQLSESSSQYVPLVKKIPTTKFKAISIHSNASVVYVPPLHEYSNPPGQIYADFDYCVTMSEIIDSRQCDSATISIVVKPVNDPPVPIVYPSSFAVVREGQYVVAMLEDLPLRPVLELSGIDVDHNSTITRIRITQPPRWGRLVLSVPQFRRDGHMDGLDLKTLNYSFALPGYVEYVSNDPETKNTKLIQGDSVVDTFQFQVADEHELWSNPKTVSIQVVSAVRVVPGEEIATSENTFSSIRLTGNDTSGWRRPISFFIESTPEAGVLVDPVTGQTLRGGTILSVRDTFPYTTGVTIHFSPKDHVCVDPNSSKTSGFSYRAIAFRPDGRLASVSDVATQSLGIQCIIHPLELELSYNNPSYQIESILNGELADDDACSGYLYNASSSQASPTNCSRNAAILQGIRVITQDVSTLQKAWVAVYSESNSGRITLNRNYWPLLDLASGREEMSSSVTFRAYPNHLENVLSFLYYQSIKPGQDSVNIVIAYGTNCTIPPDLGTNPKVFFENVSSASAFPLCQVLTRSIPITVIEAKHAPKKYLIQGFPLYILPILFGFAAFVKAKSAIQVSVHRFLCGWWHKDLPVADEPRWIQRVDPVSGKVFYED